MRISTLRHPEYNDGVEDFIKWRLCYKGGRQFIRRYLTQFSKREDLTAFKERESMSYNPAFAKAGINKLKNTFYSRMSEIVRIGGPKSYTDAVDGKGGGVDLYGTSMNAFMGCDVLEELMTMRRVGVFVDKPQLDGNVLANNQKKVPYLYIYTTEDILTWNGVYSEGEYIYTNILLCDTNYTYDESSGLASGTSTSYRHIWLADDGYVHVQLYQENLEAKSNDATAEDNKIGEEIILPMTKIPFVMGALKESLLADVADYQIGMMNIASADMMYCFKANFPFYTEQYDSASESIYTRRPPVPMSANIDTNGKAPEEGTYSEASRSGRDEIVVGALSGRRYPKGMERPDFIAPPTEPLVASMKKQEQMKQDIYELIDIAASNAQPTHASAESKQLDDRGIESGLSYIGLELEYMEREIAKIWAMYEGKDQAATIKYPVKYSLKSDAQRLDEAKALDTIKASAPSKTFAKEVAKRMADTMLSDKIKLETMQTIYNEIDAAEYVTSDPNTIQIATDAGLVDAVTASTALGFNGEKVVPLAQKEHAARLALIAASQSAGAARGVPDKSTLPAADPAVEKAAAAAAQNPQ